VSEIQFQIKEKRANNTLYTANVYFDNIYAIKVGANVVGNNTTYGFYQTGHGTAVTSCTSCHDPASDHLDGDTHSIFDYVKHVSNPTGFRFYTADPELRMQLPYTEYWPGSEYNESQKTGAFALCYTCHDEACITQDAPAASLDTNFTDYGWIAQGKDNLHLEHVGGPGSNMPAEIFHGSCVLCHDPHGQANPAMTRREMGNFIYFDADGCEIERGADTDSDDVMDWYDPDINVGGSQSEGIFTFWPDMCITCHLDPAPPDDPCSSGSDPYMQSGGMDGWYERTYKDTCAVTFATQSHSTHTTEARGPMLGEDEAACDVCHGEANIKDACTDCHSPGGAFDGVDDSVVGAWTNWAGGIYESDGAILQSGKEDWCLGCHDDDPGTTGTNESAIIDTVYASNIAGDENNGDTYGFNITGHGIKCLDCHDSNKGHIDGEDRTYEVDEGDGYSVLVPYSDSYRLRDVDGLASTYLPRDRGDALGNWRDFALCFDCHDRFEVLGQNRFDVSRTNFWDTAASIGNAHDYHLDITSRHFDSDWDLVPDSTESCITCHNVHGPPNQAMIRHGELISTYGTTDKVPALNFAYLKVPAVFETATWPVPSGTYDIYAWWSAYPARATNAKYTVNHSGGSAVFLENQTTNGGQWNQLGTVSYTFGTGGSVVLTNQGADGAIVADAIGLDGDFDGINDPDIILGTDIIVDDDDVAVTYTGTWYVYTGAGETFYGAGMHYAQQAFALDTGATLAQSIGGWMNYGGNQLSQNKVCTACHGAAEARYVRTPYLGPKVLQPKANPGTVPPDGSTEVIFTARVTDPDNNLSSVTIDLSPINGSSMQTMFDDGDSAHGDVTAGDGIYSYKTVVPTGVTHGNKTLTITATDSTPLTAQGQISLVVFNTGFFIIDNPDAVFVDEVDWNSYSGSGETFYGTDMRYKAAGGGSKTATWTPYIPAAGNYNVYAWWSAYSARASNAPYTINYDGGSETVRVSQKVNGGQWNQLGTGTYPFVVATSGSVVLSDDADGTVVADAILWEPVP
jgi:hypothetical protein